MNIFYLLLGLTLLLLAILDLLWTTLWVDGSAGPISSRLTTLLWKGLRLLAGGRARVLSLAGPIILSLTLFTWIALIWAGWVFLFAGGDQALIDTRAQEPVTWSGRIYFVAYTMFTMGNGDFTPKDGVWQIATSLTTASGMLFVTLSVSYILSVFSAVTVKRSFASTVTGLGKQSEAFVKSGWNGEDFHHLDVPLSALAAQLSTLAAQHKAYPILYYYHSQQDAQASAIAVAVLDDALTLLCSGVPEERWPNPVILQNARASARYYLDALDSAHIEPAANVPPPPELEPLKEAGIPTLPEATFTQALDELQQRRRKLLGMIQADARSWPGEEKKVEKSRG